LSKKLTYVNSLGEEFESTNSAPFLLQKFDASGNVNIYSTKGMNQDGTTYLGNTLDKGDISLEIAVIANTEEELIKYKDIIYKVFNPKLDEGWLIYKDNVKERKIKCEVNKLPYFTVISNIANKCLINLTANDPYWKELQEIKNDIALWLGDFEFPLEILETGIELGHRAPSLIVNVNTREFIKINKVMQAGETITITTDFGSKKVIGNIAGVISDSSKYLDIINSTFLLLAVDDNLFRYDADTGLDNLECEIYFTPKYLGV